MSLGPVMLDVVGKELTAEDIKRLKHPLVGGVILFSRNFESPSQLKQLTSSIHNVRQPPLLIAVDHEGGRVQRFKEGFTLIPPMREFGKIWDSHPKKAKELSAEAGWILAAELRAHGVDFSFTPVLDLDYGRSQVIGDVGCQPWVNIFLGTAMSSLIRMWRFPLMNESLMKLHKTICNHSVK